MAARGGLYGCCGLLYGTTHVPLGWPKNPGCFGLWDGIEQAPDEDGVVVLIIQGQRA